MPAAVHQGDAALGHRPDFAFLDLSTRRTVALARTTMKIGREPRLQHQAPHLRAAHRDGMTPRRRDAEDADPSRRTKPAAQADHIRLACRTKPVNRTVQLDRNLGAPSRDIQFLKPPGLP
jgi:hypothetical protein